MKREKSISIIDHVGNKAGMDYYSNLLAEALSINDINCLVFSNFTIEDNNVSYYKYFIGHTSSKLKKLINHFSAFFRSAFKCRQVGCTNAIVHLFSYAIKDLYSLLVLKLFGIRTIAIIHDVEDFSNKGKHSIRKFIFNKLCNKLVVHNNFSAKQIISIDSRLKSKLVIIPHGNFHSLFPGKKEMHKARQKLLLENGIKYLLFFGQIKKVKGLDVLLKALSKTPGNVHLIIAGKLWKEDFSQYKDLIRELNIESRVIKKIRFIEDEERNLLFNACDMLVLPYKKIFQSGVMLTAMSARIPIVASDLEPIKELITDNVTGFLFETENEKSLANSINAVINNSTLLEKVSNTAWQKTCINNNWNNIALEYVKLLNE